MRSVHWLRWLAPCFGHFTIRIQGFHASSWRGALRHAGRLISTSGSRLQKLPKTGKFLRNFLFQVQIQREGAVASWLVRLSPGTLTGTSRCFLGQNALLSQCVSPPRRIKWEPVNLMLGVTLRSGWGGGGGVTILLVASCYGNRAKLQPIGHLARMQTFYYRGSIPIILCKCNPTVTAIVTRHTSLA